MPSRCRSAGYNGVKDGARNNDQRGPFHTDKRIGEKAIRIGVTEAGDELSKLRIEGQREEDRPDQQKLTFPSHHSLNLTGQRRPFKTEVLLSYALTLSPI